MSNELIINSTQNGCRIALLKDRSLVEFHYQDDGHKFTVGDKKRGFFNELPRETNQRNIGIIHQISFTYQNFKISFFNSFGLERLEQRFRQIKSIDWYSITAGYHFVLGD